jgi:hypothetical protein
MADDPFGYEMLQDPDVAAEFMADVKRMMEHNEMLVHHYNVIVEELEEIRNSAFQIAYLIGKGKTRRARRAYRQHMKDRVWLPMLEM